MHNLINLFYFTCSAAASSMAALKQPTIRVVAIIAEGVPESDTKQLIAYARSNNKVSKMMRTELGNKYDQPINTYVSLDLAHAKNLL